MNWFPEENLVCYTDERITVRSTDDNSVLFEGLFQDLKFRFNCLPDALKENNTVECTLLGIVETTFFPFNILKSLSEECKSHYNMTYKNTDADPSQRNISQHTFCFENKEGEVLFTAKLEKKMPNDWFETYSGVRRRKPPYNLLDREKTQDIGYADNIYLNPIKQLLSAGMKYNKSGSLTCDLRDWYYSIEECIEVGRIIYPDGRIIIRENNQENSTAYGMKLFRPGMIIKDYVYLGEKKIWYVADYQENSTDEKVNVSIIFESDYAEGALLRFSGKFIRCSMELPTKVRGRIRGYIAYYRIKGLISTIGRDGGEVYENIDLYSDECKIGETLVYPIRDTFKIMNRFHNFSSNRNTTATVEQIGLDDLVGLDSVKQTFIEFKKFGEYKHKLLQMSHVEYSGDKLLNIYEHKPYTNLTDKALNDSVAFHMAFLGSPGTGKTLVAQRVASLLKSYGLIVTKEKPIVVVKSDLVGQHIGETETIVKQKLNEAMGGVLFIDEAYTLFESDNDRDFGKIALNEIMYAMDKYADKLVVIFAGYENEILSMLKNSNPGLSSRIPWYFYFDDYSATQMWEILLNKIKQSDYHFKSNEINLIESKSLEYLSILKMKMDGVKECGKTKHFFGNGRGVRTFFQYMQIGLAVRLSRESLEDLHTFTIDDIEFAYRKFMNGTERLLFDSISMVDSDN